MSASIRPGHAALRKGRISLARQIYFVTFATYRRAAHFSQWNIAVTATRRLTSPHSWQRSRLLAWVLMPDHWHGLIELGATESLVTCVGRLKGASSRAIRTQHPGLGPIWAPAFHDHALREETDLADVARYLVMNPVRAGLVRRIGDYPFWDAVWLQSGRG